MDPPQPRAADDRAPQWTRRDTVAVLGLSALAAVLRLFRLEVPSNQVFDEQFYVKDACHYATAQFRECGLVETLLEVHPPMGKWMIAIGLKIFGYNAFGARIMSVVAGTALVAIIYLLAHKLYGKTWVALVAGLFVAFDFMLFVHSRMGLLEIFIPLFLSLGFLCIVYDRDRDSDRGRSTRRWRWAGGIALGAALATKWAVVLAFPGALLLVVWWEISRRRNEGVDRPLRAMLREEGFSLVLSLGVVPLVVYILSYVGRVQGELLALPWEEGSWISAFWGQQRYMWDYFMLPRRFHSFTSFAWTWLFAREAFVYHLSSSGTTIGGVVAAGSPAMWWPVIPALLYGLVASIKDKVVRSQIVLPMVGFFATYGLWLVPSVFGYEHLFIYYLLPSIPFMALLLVGALSPLGEHRRGRAVIVALVASWVVLFAFAYPMLATVKIPLTAWDARTDLYNVCPVDLSAQSLHTLPALLSEACEVTQVVENQ